MQPVGAAVTFSELRSDVVIALAERTWGPSAPDSAPFDPRIVSRLYASELARPRRSSSVALRRMQILELSQYLERYLWPHFEAATASPEHVMSIIMMVNEKFREGVPAWDAFVQPAAGDDAAAPAEGTLPAPLTHTIRRLHTCIADTVVFSSQCQDPSVMVTFWCEDFPTIAGCLLLPIRSPCLHALFPRADQPCMRYAQQIQ